MDALAKIRAQGKMVSPHPVHAGERHRTLGVADGVLPCRRDKCRAPLGCGLPHVGNIFAHEDARAAARP